MAGQRSREDALDELVRLSEELGMYDVDLDDCRCHCERICCRHHEQDAE